MTPFLSLNSKLESTAEAEKDVILEPKNYFV